MKTFALLGCLFLVSLSLLGVSSCESKLDSFAGVHPVYDASGNLVMEPDGKTPKVIIDPDSPAARAINGAGNAGGPIGWLVGLGGAAALGSLQELLKRRLAASLKAEREAHEETQNTLAATTSGMVSFAKANPAMAAPLVDHLDAAHDAHEVDAAHQDAIQSALAPPRIG